MILLITRFARGFLNTVAVLVGLFVGTAVAAFVSNGSGGKVANFTSVQGADWVGFTGPFHFGAPKFAVRADPADDRGHADHRGRDHG